MKITYKTSLFTAEFDVSTGGPIWITDNNTGECASLEAAFAGDLGVSYEIGRDLAEIEEYFEEYE